jgi:hypothetical protein
MVGRGRQRMSLGGALEARQIDLAEAHDPWFSLLS